MLDPDDREPPRRGRSTLWTIAGALVIVSLVVTLLTPYKLFILFLPLGLAPLWFNRRR